MRKFFCLPMVGISVDIFPKLMPSIYCRESAPNWDVEIRDDVIEECNRHGGCVHVFVDKASPQGNVYVKCPTINTAVAAVNSLHGRWFGGELVRIEKLTLRTLSKVIFLL